MSKGRLVAGVAGSVLAADLVTKGLVQEHFFLGQSLPVLGDLVRLTYILNPGAAFGFHVGPWSRWVFSGLALVAMGVIAWVVRQTPASERGQLVALALILGGAVGNLSDRLRGHGAVVDFLDVGLGTLRWPVFNLADVGVTTGAALLVLLLWNDEEQPAPEARRPHDAGAAPRRSGTTVSGVPGP